MKTQIILTLLMVILLPACASLEGKQVTITKESSKKSHRFSFNEGASGREFTRQ